MRNINRTSRQTVLDINYLHVQSLRKPYAKARTRMYTLTIWPFLVFIYSPAELSGQLTSTASLINMPEVRPTC